MKDHSYICSFLFVCLFVCFVKLCQKIILSKRSFWHWKAEVICNTVFIYLNIIWGMCSEFLSISSAWEVWDFCRFLLSWQPYCPVKYHSKVFDVLNQKKMKKNICNDFKLLLKKCQNTMLWNFFSLSKLYVFKGIKLHLHSLCTNFTVVAL